MSEWKKCLLESSQSIREAIEVLDRESMQITLVVDKNQHLLGTITDGDIRRAILKGITLENSVALIMNRTPVVASLDSSLEEILGLMRQNVLRHIPVLDSAGRVVGIRTLGEFVKEDKRGNWVVIMAGGLGSRLGNLTQDCPKPLLEVGKKPLLETILEQFIAHGFQKFYFSVNYLSEQIESHFRDGSQWGADIEYIHEDRRLGTAGSLGLLQEKPKDTFIVMNGDVLTKVNFQSLLDYHDDQKAVGTMCVREYDFQVPYGVIREKEGKIISIEEKPVHRFYVNAGIYALDPGSLDYIKPNQYLDMPKLFEQFLERNDKAIIFPIREYWLDIGRIADFDRAKEDYQKVFIKEGH